ncbi:hypothetical protein HN937_05620, partial [Candidatus Poribacteria bacterium]|nr:hypothetical protein [Candidatus Poribacteria bacterium]
MDARGSMLPKLLLPITASLLVVMALVTAYMLRLKDRNTELAGLTTARAISGMVTTLRAFYTDEVVTR